MPKYNDFDLDLQKIETEDNMALVPTTRCLNTYACPGSMPEGCMLPD